jgi:tetratricopeptide (TPR) repeat protein
MAFALLFACEKAPSVRQPQVPPQARWHNNQGVVYMDQHNYTRARSEFEQAIFLAPAHAPAHANLGIALYSLGKYDSAAVSLQTALRHDPELLNAHYVLGLIYNAQGKEHDQALQALEKVSQADPDDPQVRYYLGQIKAKMGQSEAAIAEFERAIRLDPYNVSAYYGMANQLRRLDRQEEWRQALEKFNELSQAGHQGVSSSYQGQGKYAEALADQGGANPQQDDARGPFRFPAAAPPASGLAPASWAALADYDADGLPDLLLGGTGLRLYRGTASGPETVADALPPLPAGFAPSGALFGDVDNDGLTDLLLCGEPALLALATAPGQWTAPLSLEVPAHSAAFADADHDGDLDALLLWASGPRLLSNDGKGRFRDITAQAGLVSSGVAHRALFSDLDNDRDIDFLVLSGEALLLYTNNRDGTFSEVAASRGLESVRAIDFCVEDFDQDSYMDLAALAGDGRLTLYLNQRGRRFAPGAVVQLEGATRLQPADLDNDGDLDLVAYGPSKAQVLAYYQGRFHADQFSMEGDSVVPLLVADANADGLADLWLGDRWSYNQTSAGRWLKVLAQGLNSNRDGLGAKVEVKTANRLQKREVRATGQQMRELTFGLAQSDSVEFVRLLWPGGVRQTELATAAGQRLVLAELDRKGTSCPILYAWDGASFRFVTDILGGAIIGYLTAPGQYYVPDTDEYVRLGSLAPKDGYYVLQLANQLEEIIYLDALELVAVDHPAGLEVHANERLLSAPPYPEFRLYPLRRLRPPVSAHDHRGSDVLAQLVAIDDEWYDDFGRLAIHGYAEDFSLVLDLGDLSRVAHPVLLAYGWVDYAHSTSNWAAFEQGLSLYPPRVEVPDGRGGWLQVSADLGCPAGLPKYMLFDLKDLFPVQDYRLRLTTNTAVYWDQFLVGQAVEAPLRVHRLAPQRSDLHWRGYPQHTSIKGTFAFRYHYDRLNLEAPWGTHGGAFTRFGPVEELLRRIDDRYAILFHGDELTLEFSAAALPPPEPGMERLFLLYADGFGKDMDFHSAHSLTVEPLPFHAMSAYPYPPGETYPQTQAHLDYLQEYNTRWVKGYYE